MRLNLFIISIILCLTSQLAHADNRCNMDLFNQGVGPWDFYDARNSVPSGANPMGNLKRVTNRHLQPQIISLTGRVGKGSIGKDIDYTLRAIPNHPIALDVASRFEVKLALKSSKTTRLFRYEKILKSAECYFRRAISLDPNRAQTYHIYGIHLHRHSKYKEAALKYRQAISLISLAR
jgi:tetratricopeptide (TPR) repeat protein